MEKIWLKNSLFSLRWQLFLPALLTKLFFALLFFHLIAQPRVFTKRHGRRHAITGAIYLCWLLLGFVDAVYSINGFTAWIYDALLGVLGILLTLSAAADFQHKKVKNVASGTLDEHATVTHGEMIEHAYYQGINLIQITYLHALQLSINLGLRVVCCLLVTAPWYLRDLFPVNRFSDNYNKIDSKSNAFIRLLYRLKKYQYVFYKHFLLHGLNISLAISNDPKDLSTKDYFRMYWMLLNTAYVMEFFLQTLVKKSYMRQATMLWMQQILMLASTFAAFYVLRSVNVYVACLSLILNFVNRKHDFENTLLVLMGCFFWKVVANHHR